MRFFVPSAADAQESERVYQEIREKIAAMAGSVSDRRIYRLKFEKDGLRHSAIVGSDRHAFGASPVLAIFEGANGLHYICTTKNGAPDPEPHAVQSQSVLEAEEFSALA